MVRKYKKKRGPVRAKKVTYDGIKFASGLEKYMYMCLKKAKIHADYEGCTFTLQEGFMFDVESYERQSNGKGEMVNRGNKKILPIRANESFPMRWKLFKKYVNWKMKHVTLYKPQNQKECDEVIKLIIKKSKNEK